MWRRNSIWSIKLFINVLLSLFDKICFSSDFFLGIHSWSTTKDFSAIISACKSSVLACVKILEFCEVLWWSGDGFVDFFVRCAITSTRWMEVINTIATLVTCAIWNFRVKNHFLKVTCPSSLCDRYISPVNRYLQYKMQLYSIPGSWKARKNWREIEFGLQHEVMLWNAKSNMHKWFATQSSVRQNVC